MILATALAIGIVMGIPSGALVRAPAFLFASKSAAPSTSAETQGSLAGQSSAASQNSTSSQTSTAQQSPPAAPAKTSPAPAHKKRHQAAPSTPKKVVVKNGSDPDPAVQFSTDSSAQASKDKQTTDGMLANTDANLQKLSGHSLSDSQKDMLTETRSYIQQAKSAEESGDLQSAYNLALKANLLSKELVRQ